MFQLLPKYNCMFSATECLFNIISEYDNHPSPSQFKKNNLEEESLLSFTDTIIYKNGVPISWFLMENQKLIHKTNYKDMSSNEIKKTFENTSKKTKIDIDSYYLIEENKENTYLSDDFQEKNDFSFKKIVSSTQKVAFEYCSVSNIGYYLTCRKKTNGIFQKFIYPFNVNKNYIYEVTWNKYSIIVTKKMNNHFLYDKLPFEKKLFTFELGGIDETNERQFTNSRTCRIFKKICNVINYKVNYIYLYKENSIMKPHEKNGNHNTHSHSRQHSQNSQYSQRSNNNHSELVRNNKSERQNQQGSLSNLDRFSILKTITFHSKINEKGKYVLLYVTNLEFNTNINKSYQFFDFNFKVEFIISKYYDNKRISLENAKKNNLNMVVELDNKVLCIGCDMFVKKEELFEISNKIIINNHDKAYINSVYLSNSEKNVPFLINKFENFKVDHCLYLKMKDFPSFLDQTHEICSVCYLESTKYIYNISTNNTKFDIKTKVNDVKNEKDANFLMKKEMNLILKKEIDDFKKIEMIYKPKKGSYQSNEPNQIHSYIGNMNNKSSITKNITTDIKIKQNSLFSLINPYETIQLEEGIYKKNENFGLSTQVLKYLNTKEGNTKQTNKKTKIISIRKEKSKQISFNNDVKIKSNSKKSMSNVNLKISVYNCIGNSRKGENLVKTKTQKYFNTLENIYNSRGDDGKEEDGKVDLFDKRRRSIEAYQDMEIYKYKNKEDNQIQKIKKYISELKKIKLNSQNEYDD